MWPRTEPGQTVERDIQIFESERRMEITLRGPVSFLDRVHTMEVAFPILVAQQLTRILIDYSHAWVHDPTAATFEELDARLRSEPYLRQCRVALVNPPEFHAAPTESIGRDFGYPVRRFNSRRAAIAWLESPSTS